VKKAIIYGVLNWGLGHATRSIPIIRSLIQLNYEVILCSDGDALTILQKEFPQLQFVELPGYKVRYDFRSMILNMMRYSITMLKAIHKEEKILKRLVSEYQPEFIVSDNRYGFYHKKVRSIFITHQLNIPSQKKWQSLTANRFLRQFIKRFDTCWVPDLEGSPNLSGLLSHEVTISIPIQYIGPLSRLSYLDSEQKYDIAFVLSGPEPQRTKLEKMIIEQQSELKGRCCLVRGTDVPLDNAKQDIKLSVFNLLGSKDLEKLIAESRLLVCRAGYTTIMDLVSLHKSFVNQDDFNISKLDGEIEHWQGDIEIPLWSDEKLKILLNV
jgi:uncharacterized protein (TIGR00661 family)